MHSGVPWDSKIKDFSWSVVQKHNIEIFRKKDHFVGLLGPDAKATEARILV